eukprot:2178392-Rhodomonas_salina.2
MGMRGMVTTRPQVRLAAARLCVLLLAPSSSLFSPASSLSFLLPAPSFTLPPSSSLLTPLSALLTPPHSSLLPPLPDSRHDGGAESEVLLSQVTAMDSSPEKGAAR